MKIILVFINRIFVKRVEFLIVDEADKLFEEGQQSFRDQVNLAQIDFVTLKILLTFRPNF
jgi:hypothetical protein